MMTAGLDDEGLDDDDRWRMIDGGHAARLHDAS